MTPEEFIEKFGDEIEVDDDGCWLWTGYTNNRGYGMVWADGERHLNHRLVAGHIPDGKQVNHHCDVKRCCNPDHLYIGTQSENIRDALERGRVEDLEERLPTTEGESNPSAKLTADEVREIRRRYREENTTLKELASDYPCGWTNIAKIVRGDVWDYEEAYPS